MVSHYHWLSRLITWVQFRSGRLAASVRFGRVVVGKKGEQDNEGHVKYGQIERERESHTWHGMMRILPQELVFNSLAPIFVHFFFVSAQSYVIFFSSLFLYSILSRK